MLIIVIVNVDRSQLEGGQLVDNWGSTVRFVADADMRSTGLRDASSTPALRQHGASKPGNDDTLEESPAVDSRGSWGCDF